MTRPLGGSASALAARTAGREARMPAADERCTALNQHGEPCMVPRKFGTLCRYHAPPEDRA